MGLGVASEQDGWAQASGAEHFQLKERDKKWKCIPRPMAEVTTLLGGERQTRSAPLVRKLRISQ